jgi:hypothetical protein
MEKELKGAACVITCAALMSACADSGAFRDGGAASADQATDAPSPTVSFSAEANSLTAGGVTTLTWDSEHTDRCTASGGWSGTKSPSGREEVGPLEATTSFVLSCSGEGGGTLREVVVNVVNVATDEGASLSLRSSASAVLENGQIELTWLASNASQCIASGAWSGEQATSGSYTSEPLTSDATFKLTCSGTGTSAVGLVTVVVTDPIIRWEPPTENVDGSPLEDLAGFNLYWGESPGDYTSSLGLGAAARTWEVGLGTGEYFFALTALDGEGNESAYSNEVRRLMP